MPPRRVRPSPAPPATAGPLVLALETATALGGVALAGPGGLLGEITLRGAESHSEQILPALERLLAALGLGLASVAAVAVSSGPGSFTGLRTGIAAAKGLALARAVPLYGVPTLAVLAANAPPGPAPVAAFVNARRGEFYRAVFDAPGGGWPAATGPEHLVPASAPLAGLPAGCVLAGELPEGLEGSPAFRGAGHRALPLHLRHPRAEVTALRAATLLAAGAPSELAALLPRYVRPPDADLPGAARSGAICQR